MLRAQTFGHGVRVCVCFSSPQAKLPQSHCRGGQRRTSRLQGPNLHALRTCIDLPTCLQPLAISRQSRGQRSRSDTDLRRTPCISPCISEGLDRAKKHRDNSTLGPDSDSATLGAIQMQRNEDLREDVLVFVDRADICPKDLEQNWPCQSILDWQCLSVRLAESSSTRARERRDFRQEKTRRRVRCETEDGATAWTSPEKHTSERPRQSKPS